LERKIEKRKGILDISLSYPPGEAVFLNSKLIQLHQQIRFTSTAESEAATAQPQLCQTHPKA
jgi:hypothetical protein